MYKYHTLPFGASTAPAIFQRCIESVLSGLKGVAAYFEDIIVTGSKEQEHLDNLEAVLSKLQEKGFRLGCQKCSFLQPQIEYLGHIIDADGLRPTPRKLQAIKNTPSPKNIAELR